jgi:hypothetical protein
MAAGPGTERLRGGAVQEGVKALRERAPDAKAVPSAALVLNGGLALRLALPCARGSDRAPLRRPASAPGTVRPERGGTGGAAQARRRRRSF